MSLHEHLIHLRDGKLVADTPRDHVAGLVSNALEKNTLAVHFHGGLVKYSTGVETANNLCGEYAAGDAFPAFFIWESGLLETLKNNLDEIRSEDFFRMLWKVLLKVVFRKIAKTEGARAALTLSDDIDTESLTDSIDRAILADDASTLETFEIGDDIGELSELEIMTIERELELDFNLNEEIERITASLLSPDAVEKERRAKGPRVRGSTRTLIDPDALERFVTRPSPGEKGVVETALVLKAIAGLAVRVVSRFVEKRDHGLHATIVEEILRELYLSNAGKAVWDLMKQDTADAFGDNPDIHGGTAFLTELARQSTPGNRPRIVLIGHSTGAIYIAELLDKAAEILPDQHFELVFLAPASTFEKISRTVEKHNDRIDRFRMFTMLDENEKKDCLVPVLYPHSLLYFISGVLEDGYDVPIVGMKRFYDRKHFPDGAFPGVKPAREFVSGEEKGEVLSITPKNAPPGMRSASAKHGDFDNETETVASIVHLLREGFA